MALAVGATLLLSSCSSYTGAGAYTGAQFGSILGSAIGGISGGPRGSDIGTIVGMAGGAMVGATIGNAADRKAHGKMDNDYPSNRGGYDSSYLLLDLFHYIYRHTKLSLQLLFSAKIIIFLLSSIDFCLN